MARIRSVHPNICVSETMAALSAELERTFVRLWTHCDDYGRCPDNPRLVKAALYPLDDTMTAARVDKELAALAEQNLIVRYEVDGRRYLQVRSWDEFQHPARPGKDLYPQMPDGASRVLDARDEPPRVRDEVSLHPNESPTAGVGEGEGEGTGEGEGVCVAYDAKNGQSPAKRARDPIWDALMEACEIKGPVPKNARGAYNRATADLRDVEATPDEIARRAAVYRTKWPNVSLTPTALARHWAECDRYAKQPATAAQRAFAEAQALEAQHDSPASSTPRSHDRRELGAG